MDRIDRVAREAFGFEALRPGQREAIESVLAGRDTLVVMSTGSGKSAIYQIAGLLTEGATVVVSPLIALQRDQVDDLAERAAGRSGAAQLQPAGVGARPRAGRAGRERARVPVPGARAARQRGGPGRAVRRAAVAARDRRGALHLRVGPRLPARVPAGRRGRRGARPPADPRPDRDGGPARARRDRRAARPARPGGPRARLRPAQHPPRGRALPRRAGGRAQAARAAGRRRGGAEAGDRLRRHPPPGRGARGVAVRARRHRRLLPRRHARGRARRGAGALHGLGARGRGRHHRVRHGHRQGGRALGLPQRGLRVARRLLPGDRARRPRRGAARTRGSSTAARTSGCGASSRPAATWRSTRSRRCSPRSPAA